MKKLPQQLDLGVCRERLDCVAIWASIGRCGIVRFRRIEDQLCCCVADICRPAEGLAKLGNLGLKLPSASQTDKSNEAELGIPIGSFRQHGGTP